jgi:hypothetical protein
MPDWLFLSLVTPLVLISAFFARACVAIIWPSAQGSRSLVIALAIVACIATWQGMAIYLKGWILGSHNSGYWLIAFLSLNAALAAAIANLHVSSD